MKCVIDQKRETDRPLVCPPCRRGLADDLRALVDAYAVLSTGDVEPTMVGVFVEDDGGWDGPRVYDVHSLSAGPVRQQAGGAPVSGSREAPVPINLDVIDLTLPAGPGAIYDPLGDLAAMQVGLIPVATVLDQWVRDWISYTWCPGDHLPVPTVVTLVDWLSKRLDVACDRHEGIDEFAGDIRRLLSQCQRAVNDVPPRPTVLDGVPCATPECDGILLHQPGGDYWAECGLCGRLWREDEYRQWVALVAAQTRRPAA